MQVVSYSAKKTGDRHWHIAIPLLLGAGLLVALPLVEGRVMWLAFTLLSLGCLCVWAPHGPLLSWPAAILPGTAAATGRLPPSLTLISPVQRPFNRLGLCQGKPPVHNRGAAPSLKVPAILHPCYDIP